MKKVLYLLCILVLSVGFVGCRSREEQTNTVYTEEEFGIELKLPTGWAENTEIETTKYNDKSGGGQIDVYLKTENPKFKPLLLQVFVANDEKWDEIKDNAKEIKNEDGFHYAYDKPKLEDVLKSEEGTKEEKDLYENYYISDDSIENIITFTE
jgi:hypothetical protein